MSSASATAASAPRGASMVPGLHLSAASVPMSVSPPNSGRREAAGHHHSHSSIVMADPFEFVSSSSEVDQQVMITFRRFAAHSEIASLTTHLTPLKDETETLKQIKRSKSALESQTKWWLVEAGVIMGNAIFNKFYEEWTTLGGYDLADISCTGLGLHMSVSLSSVNSSYFAEVSDSHKNLFKALQGQYTKLGEYLLEYLIKADFNYKVRKEFRSQRPDNIRRIKALAEAAERNLDRIATALTDAYSKPLQPKGWWGKTVSLIAGLFIKTNQTKEIEIALPLRMAILVIKRKAAEVVVTSPREAHLHRPGNSDPEVRSPQAAASALPIGLTHEEQIYFHDMEAFYERRKVEIIRMIDERQTQADMRLSHQLTMSMVCYTMTRVELRRPSTMKIELVGDRKDAKGEEPPDSADLKGDIDGLRRRLKVIQKADPNNKAVQDCLAKLGRIASDDKSEISDRQKQLQEVREEIACLSSALFSVQVLKMDGQTAEGPVDGAQQKVFKRQAIEVQQFFLTMMEQGFGADQKAQSNHTQIAALKGEISSLKERLAALSQIAANTAEITRLGLRLDTIVQQMEERPNLRAVRDEITNVRDNIASQTRQIIEQMQQPEQEARAKLAAEVERLAKVISTLDADKVSKAMLDTQLHTLQVAVEREGVKRAEVLKIGLEQAITRLENQNEKVVEHLRLVKADLAAELASLRKRIEAISSLGAGDPILLARLGGLEKVVSTIGVEADAKLPSIEREIRYLKNDVAKHSMALIEQMERNLKFQTSIQDNRMQMIAMGTDRARDRAELMEVVSASINSIGARVDAISERLFTHEARLMKQRHYEAREADDGDTRRSRGRVLALPAPSVAAAAAPSPSSLSDRRVVPRALTPPKTGAAKK